MICTPEVIPRHIVQVDESVMEVAGIVRENVVLRAAQAFASPGHISTYIHSPMGPSCGAMCSAVALENDTLDLSHSPPERVVEFGKHLAMQVRSLTHSITISLCMPYCRGSWHHSSSFSTHDFHTHAARISVDQCCLQEFSIVGRGPEAVICPIAAFDCVR